MVVLGWELGSYVGKNFRQVPKGPLVPQAVTCQSKGAHSGLGGKEK